MHPKTLRWLLSGGFPVRTSSGVLLFKAVEGHLFIKYAVVVTASTQNDLGSFALRSINLVLSNKVLLTLSATRFC